MRILLTQPVELSATKASFHCSFQFDHIIISYLCKGSSVQGSPCCSNCWANLFETYKCSRIYWMMSNVNCSKSHFTLPNTERDIGMAQK